MSAGGLRRQAIAKAAPLRKITEDRDRGENQDDDYFDGGGSEDEAPSEPKTLPDGDYTPLSWSDGFFEERTPLELDDGTYIVYHKGPREGTQLVLLHGGGLGALSWAPLAAALNTTNCGVFTFDMRGHGHTTTSNDTDLSSETLCADVGRIVFAFYGSTLPPIVLVGHSMGGALASHVAAAKIFSTLVGLVLIDVVEGTALMALGGMQLYLHKRQSIFQSIEDSIIWSVTKGPLNRLDSARVSMPPLMRALESGKFTWRTDLQSSEVYWEGWFKGLSTEFLSIKVPKLLILAQTATLDTPLTIGQMQGKFQLKVVPYSGHCIHEDAPTTTAEHIWDFVTRNRWVA